MHPFPIVLVIPFLGLVKANVFFWLALPKSRLFGDSLLGARLPSSSLEVTTEVEEVGPGLNCCS